MTWYELLDDRLPSPSQEVRRKLLTIHALAKTLEQDLGLSPEEFEQTIAGQPANLARELADMAVDVADAVERGTVPLS